MWIIHNQVEKEKIHGQNHHLFGGSSVTFLASYPVTSDNYDGMTITCTGRWRRTYIFQYFIFQGRNIKMHCRELSHSSHSQQLATGPADGCGAMHGHAVSRVTCHNSVTTSHQMSGPLRTCPRISSMDITLIVRRCDFALRARVF